MGNGTVTTGGTVERSGSNAINANGTLTVVSGTTTLTVGATQGIKGTVNVESGATLVSNSGDALNFSGSGTVNIAGTLAMGTTRWTFGSNNNFILQEGAEVTGTGDGKGALDLSQLTSSEITITANGNATISAPIRNDRQANTGVITVAAGKTLTVSSAITGGYAIRKKGTGTLKLTGSATHVPLVEEGTLILSGGAWDVETLRDLSGIQLEDGATISVTQTQAEYGLGETTLTNVDTGITEITLNKFDGTSTTLTREDSTITLSESPVVTGAACWYDFTFDETHQVTTVSGSTAGSVTLTDGYDKKTLTDAKENEYEGENLAKCPYTSISFGGKSQFSVALFGTMPSGNSSAHRESAHCLAISLPEAFLSRVG